jgi:ribosome-associated protein
MLRVTEGVYIDEREIEETFVRSSGPGGQKVNKASTAVQLRFDVANSPSLPDDVRARLMALERNRIASDGVLVIDARRYRSQNHNRADATQRLIAAIRNATKEPKRRLKTGPTAASRRRRLEIKRRRSQIKKLRRQVESYED